MKQNTRWKNITKALPKSFVSCGKREEKNFQISQIFVTKTNCIMWQVFTFLYFILSLTKPIKLKSFFMKLLRLEQKVNVR